MPNSTITIIKKDGRQQQYDDSRIIAALNKAAARTKHPLTKEEEQHILDNVHDIIKNFQNTKVHVSDMHDIVQRATITVRYDVAAEYSNYRNYKKEQLEQTAALIEILDNVESFTNLTYEDEGKREDHVRALIKEQVSKHSDTSNIFLLFNIINADAIRLRDKDYLSLVKSNEGFDQLIAWIKIEVTRQRRTTNKKG